MFVTAGSGPAEANIVETVPNMNTYNLSKLAFNWQSSRRAARGEPAPPRRAGLKCFNANGPREQRKGSMRSVMATNVDWLRRGALLRLFKSDRPDYCDGGQQRDFIYVADCVSVVRWMLDNEFLSGIYNFSTENAQTWLDTAKVKLATLQQEVMIEFIDMPSNLVDRCQYFAKATIAKLRAIGARLPSTSLTEGVRQTYYYTAAKAACQ